LGDFYLPDEKWQAILNNDAAFDGQFVYGVSSTGIFCRPSCKSRPPKKENTQIFASSREALDARYRPCKRCRPTGERMPDEEWISMVTEYIRRHYAAPLHLQTLADISHSSPFHLHRTFKRITGQTPSAYVQQVRIEQAAAELLTTDKPVSVIGTDVGLANTPYFITLFKNQTGCTPAQYRKQHTDAVKGGMLE
jgi:AraC family transcriptional regulator, regulatory protein of adaptative response / methylphosphotriester-DNA alkyltransferase methyltransferase